MDVKIGERLVGRSKYERGECFGKCVLSRIAWYIRKGNVIYGDGMKDADGSSHSVINHTENLVEAEEANIHT